MQRLRQRMTAGIAVATVCCGVAPAAMASAPRARVGDATVLSNTSSLTGSVSASRTIGLDLALTPRNPLGMARMATAVSTPGSSSYRGYLTVGQFASRYGATDAAIARVTRTLRADGLHVGTVEANHLMLSVSGSVGAVEHALQTRISGVRLANGRRAYANVTAPTLPVSIASDVAGVIGLDTTYRPQSDQVARPSADALPAAGGSAGGALPEAGGGVPTACAAANKVASSRLPGYTANSIQAAYNFSGLYAAGDHGGGQTVALYELEKVNPADIRAYQRCYGTHAKISYVTTNDRGRPKSDLEAGLDIEQILGLAPKAHLLVYQTADTVLAGVRQFNKIVAQNRARTVSVSWGSCEPKVTDFRHDLSVVRAENLIFQEAAIQGQSILSASGDTGSSGCQAEFGTDGLSVQDPSSQPFATAVGGTTLYTIANGRPALWDYANPANGALQSVWNDGTVHFHGHTLVSGSGGGISELWGMPTYQSAANPSLAVINADSSSAPCKSSKDCREVPDVSADADPESGYIVHVHSSRTHSGWVVEGGTSAAAPLWAAFTALADALPSCKGHPLGFENPALYQVAGSVPNNIFDVTLANPVSGLGSNDASGRDHGLYPVTAGYDMATGLGTPDVASLAQTMCGLPNNAVAVKVPKHAPVAVHHEMHIKITGSDSGKLALHYRARGLPRGVSISRRRGLISGRPRHTGKYHVVVSARDLTGAHGSARFTLTVTAHPQHHRSGHKHHSHH